MKKFIALSLNLVLIFALFSNNLAYALSSTKVYAGTKIPLATEQLYTSKEVESGVKVIAKVQNDIKIDGVIVFKEGSMASINVSDADKARCWGRPGYIMIANGTVQDVKGINRPVEITQKFVGEEKTYPKVLGCISIFFLWPLALFGFVHGGQGKIMPGKTFNVTLLSDFSI